MTDKLKPCPFCGGNAKVRETGYRKWDGSHRRFYIVECECCTVNIENDKKEEAITSWNTRKPMDRIVEQLEKLRQEYPYKVVGEYDTYSTYNEAWSDCSDRAIAIAKGVQNE